MIKFFEKHNVLSWIITLITAGFIFYISSLPAGKTPTLGFSIETILYHLIIFFFLGAFLLLSIVKGKNKAFFFVPIAIALMYAVLDEFHQLFVQGRVNSFADFLLDSAGILTASLIYIFSLKFRR